MKKKYQRPMIEFVILISHDLIATSDPQETDIFRMENPWGGV